jgi:hypothetical protein
VTRLALAIVAALATEARADQDEASYHLQLVGGVARLGDDAAVDDAVAVTPLGGVAGRVSYATRDWLQYDAAATIAASGAAGFAMGHFTPPDAPDASGPFSVSAQLARVDVGATARLGVRWIPTARLAIGAQGRRTSAPDGFPGQVREPSIGADLVAVASIGVDYRIDRRTIIGVSAGGSYALPLGGAGFQTMEATVFWAHYWYPRL